MSAGNVATIFAVGLIRRSESIEDCMRDLPLRIQTLLNEKGISYVGCTEKSELHGLLSQAMEAAGEARRSGASLPMASPRPAPPAASEAGALRVASGTTDTTREEVWEWSSSSDELAMSDSDHDGGGIDAGGGTGVLGAAGAAAAAAGRLGNINDPEHPLTLEQLNVATLENVQVDDAAGTVMVHFTPTIPHCSMATLIGLCIRVKLLAAATARIDDKNKAASRPMVSYS
eukprot:g4696.t1